MKMATTREILKQKIKDNEERIQHLFKINEYLRRKLNNIHQGDIEKLGIDDVKQARRGILLELCNDFQPDLRVVIYAENLNNWINKKLKEIMDK